MDIKGKLVEVFETVQVKDTFRKREFVLEYAENPQYPELIKFELIQEKCDLLDGMNVGDEVQVFFNLKGRKWTDPQGQVKYFNSLQAWKLQAATAMESGMPMDEAPADQDEPAWLNAGGEEDDDLPF